MDIPRSPKPLAIIAVLPAVLIPVFQSKGDQFPFVLVVCVGAVVMLVALLTYASYMRRTPLVRIDEQCLTFFGNSQSQQRSFQRGAITNILLYKRPNFWRSAFRLVVVVNAETVDLWIPYVSAFVLPTLAQALRNEFPGKFEEVLP